MWQVVAEIPLHVPLFLLLHHHHHHYPRSQSSLREEEAGGSPYWRCSRSQKLLHSWYNRLFGSRDSLLQWLRNLYLRQPMLACSEKRVLTILCSLCLSDPLYQFAVLYLLCTFNIGVQVRSKNRWISITITKEGKAVTLAHALALDEGFSDQTWSVTLAFGEFYIL